MIEEQLQARIHSILTLLRGFAGVAGNAGNWLLSQGAFDVPTWLANAASSAYYLVGGASPAWSLIPTPSPSYTIYR